MSIQIVAKYLGDGRQFYNGVPARDLETGDWARLSKGQRDWVRLGDLYEMVEVESLKVSGKKAGKSRK